MASASTVGQLTETNNLFEYVEPPWFSLQSLAWTSLRTLATSSPTMHLRDVWSMPLWNKRHPPQKKKKTQCLSFSVYHIKTIWWQQTMLKKVNYGCLQSLASWMNKDSLLSKDSWHLTTFSKISCFLGHLRPVMTLPLYIPLSSQKRSWTCCNSSLPSALDTREPELYHFLKNRDYH